MPNDLDRRELSPWNSWFNRPLSRTWCIVGWLIATVIFVGGTQQLGGVTSGDASDSVNTAWSIAHGMTSCGYAPGNQYGLPYSAPLYPLLSGGLAALVRIGHQVPFPTSADFGPHCSTAIAAMYHWSLGSGSLLPTLRLGYVGWLVLMAGFVALLRSSGRGRCVWEPTSLVLLALVPPVFMCLHEYFHPQDLVAMGLILGTVACVRRESWIWAGILLGLAFTSQQFALLVLAPLVVIAPANRLFRFVAATVGSIVVIASPLVVLAPRGALKALLAGSGTTWVSSTLLDVTRLSGPSLVIVSRFLPIAAAMILAWWARDRLGASVLEPIPLISLLATSLSFRLLFEVNLWGYYFMTVAVLVLALDVARARLRWMYFAWVALIAVAFHPVVGASSALRSSTTPWFSLWVWQLLLATLGAVLAISPLITFMKQARTMQSTPGGVD